MYVDRSGDMREQTTPYSVIINALENFPGLHTVILFGSIASGKANMDSDLDLAVDFGKTMSAQQKIKLISNLAEATGRPIDLIDLASVGEPLLGQILQGGKRLIGSNRDFAVLLSKHLGNEADFMPYYRRLLKQRRKAWIGM